MILGDSKHQTIGGLQGTVRDGKTANVRHFSQGTVGPVLDGELQGNFRK